VAIHVRVDISQAGSLVIPADFLFALGKDQADPAAVEPLGRELSELLLSEKGGVHLNAQHSAPNRGEQRPRMRLRIDPW